MPPEISDCRLRPAGMFFPDIIPGIEASNVTAPIIITNNQICNSTIPKLRHYYEITFTALKFFAIAMAMPQNFALLKTKITSPVLFTLFRNKA